jgi:hypothetical protein
MDELADHGQKLNVFFTPTHKQVDTNIIIKRQDLSVSSANDWKKMVSDKLVKRISKHREDRMDSVRLHKGRILEEIVYENAINDHCEEDNLILSDYFDKILSLFEQDKISTCEYEYELCRDSNISVCPFCSYPAILNKNKVLCLNLCFEYNLNQGYIHDNFNFDNFIDLLASTYKEHRHCFSYDNRFDILYFEESLQIVCLKCFSECLYN